MFINFTFVLIKLYSTTIIVGYKFVKLSPNFRYTPKMDMILTKSNDILNKYDESDYSDEESVDTDEGWQSNTRNLVHKLILAVHSPVFEAMFYGSFAHVGNTIEFKDVSLQTFKWILSYMYLGVYILHDFNMAIDIYSYAHEKQMNSLVKRCSKFISEKVTSENALKVLEMANLYDDEDLKSVSTQKMFEKRESLFASKEIGEMPKKLLLDIVSRDKIFCPERDLFNFIYIWAKMQVKKRNPMARSNEIREEMKVFFPYINFLLMNSDYFITNVMKTCVLTPEESLAILNCIIKQTSKNKLPSFVSKSKKERFFRDCSLVNYSVILNRFSQCNLSFIYNHSREVYSDRIIVFRVSEDILISSIKLKTDCYTGSWKMNIMNFEERELGVSSNTHSPYNFENLVPISANTCYVCVMKGRGKRSKHCIVDYEATIGEINFYGIAIACNITINFTR
ncbi:BTB/POZ domain-containing protein 2 [Armadillidium nasatum]|uniref:BTB/POZ domain-containing protein 2 n=1 Tax=Armadillidium nasatum TaxID=96803 RepID=A0A5N5SUW2_9CRUS|nr:BTB/POZ domain-containing protein 2 [Armadillidium nasatum]